MWDTTAWWVEPELYRGNGVRSFSTDRGRAVTGDNTSRSIRTAPLLRLSTKWWLSISGGRSTSHWLRLVVSLVKWSLHVSFQGMWRTRHTSYLSRSGQGVLCGYCHLSYHHIIDQHTHSRTPIVIPGRAESVYVRVKSICFISRVPPHVLGYGKARLSCVQQRRREATLRCGSVLKRSIAHQYTENENTLVR